MAPSSFIVAGSGVVAYPDARLKFTKRRKHCARCHAPIDRTFYWLLNQWTWTCRACGDAVRATGEAVR